MKYSHEVEQKLAALESYYVSDQVIKNPRVNSVSLHSGISGVIITLLEFYRRNKNAGCKKRMQAYLEKLFEMIETQSHFMAAFCNGFAGVGWTLVSIQQDLKDVAEIDLDEFTDLDFFLNELDVALSKSAEKMLADSDEFDLLHGSLGLGLYFLKRKKLDVVERIIDSLNDSAIVEAREIKFKRFDQYKSRLFLYDFGLSHGNAGILYFLGKCYSEGCAKGTCLKLIQGITNFYQNNIQDIDAAGSYYPMVVPVHEYQCGANPFQRSRLAWCYGDLGILHTLLLISVWTENKSLKDEVVRQLLKSANRKLEEDPELADSQFCHGMSGIACIFQSAYNLTGIIEFRNATEYWIHKIVNDCHDASRGVEGFLFKMGENVGWIEMVDMLSGISGVSSYLLAYLDSMKKPQWDEIFFLS